MVSDEAFLRAIREDPDNDASRLVCADWLDEHGESDRAEFIRIQCELARLPAYDPRRPGLARRERALLDQYALEWAEPLRGFIDEWTYARGFIEKISLDRTDTFRWAAEELFRLAPVLHIRFVEPQRDRASRFAEARSIGGPQIDMEDLATSVPQMRLLTGLEVYFSDCPPPNATALRRLLSSPHLGRLKRLTLMHQNERNEGFDPAALVALERNCVLTCLSDLELGDLGEPADPFIETLALSRLLARIERLILHGCSMSNDSARSLFAYCVRAKRLQSLGLVRCSTGEPGWRSLLEHRWRALQKLHLESCYPSGVARLTVRGLPLWDELLAHFGGILIQDYEQDRVLWTGHRWQ